MAPLQPPKRRRAYIVGLDKQTPTKVKRRKLVQGRPKRFDFLELPGELQNLMYEAFAASVTIVYISPKGDGRATSNHPIRLACRQTHRQFGGWLSKDPPTAATEIVAHVVDFNFRPMTVYINRMLAKIHKGIRAGSPPPAPLTVKSRVTHKLTIHFTITSDWCKNPDSEAILRFFRWTRKIMPNGQGGAGGMQGALIQFCYRVKEVEDKASASRLLNNIGSGNAQSKVWAAFLQAFNNYFKYGHEEKTKAQAKLKQKQERLGQAKADALIRELDVEYSEFWGDHDQ